MLAPIYKSKVHVLQISSSKQEIKQLKEPFSDMRQLIGIALVALLCATTNGQQVSWDGHTRTD